jgi:dienelactone hydrolase
MSVLFTRADRPPAQQPPLRDNLVTVFYPGFGSSRRQGSKYAGTEGVTVLSHEGDKVLFHCTTKFAPRILHNIVPLPEVPELHYGVSLNPVHWITMAACKAKSAVFRYEGAPVSHMHLSKVNIGGLKDQQQCRNDIQRGAMEAARSNKKLVVFGCSRGASTVLYTVLSLPPELAAAVALVIVEAPFDTCENVIKDSSYCPKLVMSMIRNLGDYSGNDAYKIPDVTHLKCPIAFVTSKVDTRVPPHLTINLMNELRQKHPQLTIEYLELQHSHHALMANGNAEDQQAYIAFVSRLYDKYVPQEACDVRHSLTAPDAAPVCDFVLQPA